jgi:hypothetical protein
LEEELKKIQVKIIAFESKIALLEKEETKLLIEIAKEEKKIED